VTFQGTGLACIRGERLVFRAVDFVLDQGDALVLGGPNGSGKSSLLRLMAGLLPPAEGRLDWDGTPVADDPEAHRARLAFLGPLDAIKPGLTVAEDLRFWARLRGRGSIEAPLAAHGLEAFADTPCRYLSTGQRRRLALARLGAAAAALWLMDEPTLGLDAQALGGLLGAIGGHRAAGGRVVVATHVALDLPGARMLALGP